MTERDRDRLVALKKARKGMITKRQTAEELGQSERHCSPAGRRANGGCFLKGHGGGWVGSPTCDAGRGRFYCDAPWVVDSIG
jgi:hypothetical protein